MKLGMSLGLAVVCVGLVACGEKPQTAATRKADQAPYATSASAFTTGEWKQGDAVAWERHLNARAQSGQNEYGRTGPH